MKRIIIPLALSVVFLGALVLAGCEEEKEMSTQSPQRPAVKAQCSPNMPRGAQACRPAKAKAACDATCPSSGKCTLAANCGDKSCCHPKAAKCGPEGKCDTMAKCGPRGTCAPKTRCAMPKPKGCCGTCGG